MPQALGSTSTTVVQSPAKKGDLATVRSDILNLFSKAVEFKKPWTTRALEMYALYRCVEDEVSAKEVGARYKGRSRVIDPEPNRVLETVAARVARGATVRYSPQEGTDVERSKALTEVIAHYLRKARFGVKSRLWVKDALITGTGFLKLTWEHKTETKRERAPRFILRNPVNGREMVRFGTITKMKESVITDMPKIEILDFGDVFVSPWATDPLDYPHIFHSFRVENKDVLKANPNYDQKQIDLIGSTEDPKKKQGDQLKEDKYAATGARLPSDDKGIHGVEFWGKYDLDGDGVEENVVIAVVGDQVIRAEENPFFYDKPPIIAYRPIPVPHEYYGMALLEAARSMFHALTALRRQRIDAGTLSLNPILRVLRTAGIVDAELVSTPGAIWHQDDPQGIQPIQMPEPSQFAYAEVRELKRDIRDVTGASEFVSGGDSLTADRATATEFVGKVEQANLKFRQMLDMFEEEALAEFGDMLKSHVHQFMSKAVTVRLLGQEANPDVLSVRAKDILGDYDTITETEASSVGNRQQRFQNVLQGYNLFNNDPFINQLLLRRKVMVEGFEWKDANELIVNPQEQQGSREKDELMQADEENQAPEIAQVRPDDNHEVHLDVHDAFIRSESFMELTEAQQATLMQHREDHAELMQQTTVAGRETPQKAGSPGNSADIVPGPGRPPVDTREQIGVR